MTRELDDDWTLILYYSDGTVLMRKVGAYDSFLTVLSDRETAELDRTRALGITITESHKRYLVRFHFVAPDWFPVRSADSKSGNPFAVTKEEKRIWNLGISAPWNPLGIFRKKHVDTTPKEPGF